MNLVDGRTRRVLPPRALASAALLVFGLLLIIGSGFILATTQPQDTYVRVNQVGYLPDDAKVAIAFSDRSIRGRFRVVDDVSGEIVLRGTPDRSSAPTWGGRYTNYYEIDFSSVDRPGTYRVMLDRSGASSPAFRIGADAYGDYQEDVLEFMRQQRCGYNPTLDMVCHQKDGRSFYGPMPDSSYVDVSEGGTTRATS